MDGLRFPMFVDLRGKRAVVVGCGAIGSRRATVLRDFGAHVVVVDPNNSIDGAEHLRREYIPGDVAGAFLCVAATDSREINRAVGDEARALGVPVSVADARCECDFYFPAVCIGGGLVAGVVSDGASHGKTAACAREIRRVLEGFDED